MLRSFEVTHDGRTYTLKAASPFERRFLLRRAGRVLGSIAPQHIFTRKARIDLPEDLPLELRVFLTWLVILLWKHQQSAAAAS